MSQKEPVDVFGSTKYTRNAGLEVLKAVLAQQVEQLGKLKDSIPALENEIIELTAAVGVLSLEYPGPRLSEPTETKKKEADACPTS